MNTQHLSKQALVALLIAGCLLFGNACDRTSSKTEDNAPATAQPVDIPERATPRPVMLDPSQRPVYKPPAFQMPVYVWATRASVTLADTPQADPLPLELGDRLIATGLQGKNVSVALPDGRRGEVPFCLTDFGPAAADQSGRSRALPAPVRVAAIRAFSDCLTELTANPQVGVVLQGPVKLAAEPDKDAMPDAPQVESWQQVSIEPDPTAPPMWVRVRLNAETSGYLNRHHLAVGGDPGWKVFRSPEGLHVVNYLPTTSESLDFWMIDSSLARFIPTVVSGTQESDGWKAGWLEGPRRLDSIQWIPPVERFTWPMDAIWRQSEGVWMPDDAQAAPSCDRLPTRLNIISGQLALTRGKAINTHLDISKAVPQANGTAMLWAKKPKDQPVAILYWVANRKDQLAILWLVQPDPSHPAPELWIRLDEKQAASREAESRARLGCDQPPDSKSP